MRIVYVAKHNSGGGDDEGAISHALRELGHEVLEMDERRGDNLRRVKADVLLFHKWSNYAALTGTQGRMLRVCWYFDLVDYPSDPTLAKRCKQRKEWMADTLPNVDLMFCTDGDWVQRCHENGHMHVYWLPQGADTRVVGRGDPSNVATSAQILFTGVRNGGKGRASFVDDMKETYGDKFLHIAAGIHGSKLANLIAKVPIVVAPDEPLTDAYYSNRVYQVLGFGGFLLHPWCAALTKQYMDGDDLVFYSSRHYLHDKIDAYLNSPNERNRISDNGFRTTLEEHTYKHRCERMLAIIKERLCLSQS